MVEEDDWITPLAALEIAGQWVGPRLDDQAIKELVSTWLQQTDVPCVAQEAQYWHESASDYACEWHEPLWGSPVGEGRVSVLPDSFWNGASLTRGGRAESIFNGVRIRRSFLERMLQLAGYSCPSIAASVAGPFPNANLAGLEAIAPSSFDSSGGSEDSLQRWARDAAARDVKIGECKADADARMAGKAPATDKCVAALHQAYNAVGKPVKRGRRKGSKSFAG